MAAYRRVYDSRHLRAECQEPRSAPEPYSQQSSTGYVFSWPREVLSTVMPDYSQSGRDHCHVTSFRIYPPLKYRCNGYS